MNRRVLVPGELQVMANLAQQLFANHPRVPEFTREIDVVYTSNPHAHPMPTIRGEDEYYFPQLPPVEESRGLTNAAIVRIPIHLIKGLQKKELCAVCHENFCTNPFAKQLPCGHSFHPHCIGEWLIRNAKCPVCRSEVKMR